MHILGLELIVLYVYRPPRRNNDPCTKKKNKALRTSTVSCGANVMIVGDFSMNFLTNGDDRLNIETVMKS